MKVINILVEEHVLIKKTLDLFEKAAKGIGNDQRPSVEFFEKSLRFCKTFADKY
ncbi:MAG: hypothetical protein GY865_19985, partial [candidate division Zixibacteria bacterium]|nr:hypothetical protein [candidate division Zixibacteria bacterium]